MQDLLDTKGAAARIGVTLHTLENWRHLGLGPRFIKLHGLRGKTLYDPADIAAWLEERRFRSTAEINV